MMIEIYILLFFMLGVLLGWLISHYRYSKSDSAIKEDLYRYKARIAEIEINKKDQDKIRLEFEHIFKSLASDISQKNSHDFLKMATDKFKTLSDNSNKDLDEKKKLIDLNLGRMNDRLEKIHKQSTELQSNISSSKDITENLRDKTIELTKVLSSSQTRGQWGERMVEDILSHIGLEENIQYKAQMVQSSGGKPDYTFFLPKGKKLNMDIKFPYDNYERYVNADTDNDIKEYRKRFLANVKDRIKELTTREYINESTVDYVLLFIPNESIYSFIHRQREGKEIIDNALNSHVLLCSPLTLYAILSLIHQSLNSFTIEEKAKEMMGIMHEFKIQWNKYQDKMNTMGRAINTANKAFDDMVGARKNKLDKSLKEIDQLSNISIDDNKEKIDQTILSEDTLY